MLTKSSFLSPVYLLRVEGLCVLICSCGAYQALFPHHWVMFACLLLVPDLSLVAYAVGSNGRASSAYNLVHSYTLPVLLGMFAVFNHRVLLGEMSVIWIGHIGMDRTLGWGLKYASSFNFTHIQSAANPAILAEVLGPLNQ